MPRHNAQESGDRAALLSPPDLSPTGADEVFVPNNGVITFNVNRPPTEKKTEGLYKSRVSCFVKTSELGLACASRQAKAVSRVSGLVNT